ncbi:diguanylate cyclase [Alkalihalobacillus sp. BA299]|uniref:GGDEF domain-containing response regulator n=1 Tax=Alkalihalobacillus sp. BA299 TaxID=2815938 RepID=UPI001ADBE29B|nr:diguanylate cyclase [Alkalihalobacillus sp. BA299]
MEKYRQALLQKIQKQLHQWFNQYKPVFHFEVYRFLHSIQGTAATIGLDEIYRISVRLISEVDKNEDKEWEIYKLQHFLSELVTVCYQNITGDLSFEDDPVVTVNTDLPEILLIDDDITLLMYLKEELERQGWHVFATADPEKAISFFYDYQPDCVIIDLYLKEKTGFSILSILNHKLKQQFVPQIMISVNNGKEVRMKSYELGADDFIAKPFDIHEFIIRVKRQLERKTLVDSLVLKDELSLVYNRKYLIIVFERLCNDIYREQNSFCLAILDLDYFKRINDQYGHLVGDEVIKEFAAYLNKYSRKNDTVFRYGGEEFIILFSNTRMYEAAKVLNRLLQGFSEKVFETGKEEFSVTFSAGVVEVSDPDIEIESWLKVADSALYNAKKHGRNQIKLWDSKLLKAQMRTVHVAIVDDDLIIRTILIDILKRIVDEGHIELEVSSFKSGKELFQQEWHKTEKTGLIILDGIMPDIDGNEVLKRIRSLENNNRFTVLMLTARKSEKDISQALQLGADDYVTKPFNIHVIEDRIKRLLRKLK